MVHNKCWICNSLAKTAEHKIKKTDLKLLFPDYINEKGKRLSLKNSNNNKITIIQGLNSKEVKYQKNLCANCNNYKTQSHDKAYEILINYMAENFKLILKERFINLKLVYKQNVKINQLNLFRYFAKAFGCSINTTNRKIPNTILKIINGESYGKDFFVTLSINEELFNKNSKLEGLAGCSNLECLEEKMTKEETWIWSQNLNWLMITYWYKAEIINGAIPWYGKRNRISFSKFYFS